MPVAGFQTVSDELNPYKQKHGDFGGYCLAWCSWYIEHRILNIHVKPKDLVTKLIKKIASDKYTFMEYIRNYANKLNDTRTEHLIKAGLDKNIISNITLSNKEQNKITNYIFNSFRSYKIK
jgi:hypothetical protein